MDEKPTYDPAPLLTNSVMGMVWLLIVFVGGIIAAQIWKTGTANTESWAALTGIIGWATAKAGDIFNNRFGSTAQSAAKDLTIATQARTASNAQRALLDPAVVVTVDPSKRTGAGGPIVTDNINVEANTATVNEAPTGKENP